MEHVRAPLERTSLEMTAWDSSFHSWEMQSPGHQGSGVLGEDLANFCLPARLSVLFYTVTAIHWEKQAASGMWVWSWPSQKLAQDLGFVLRAERGSGPSHPPQSQPSHRPWRKQTPSLKPVRPLPAGPLGLTLKSTCM